MKHFFNQLLIFYCFFFLLVVYSCGSLERTDVDHSNQSATRSFSSVEVKWKFKPRGAIIAIGDVHADPSVLVDILINEKILNKNGEIIAENFDLVLLGDYASKGPDTKGVWDVILYLTKNAKKKNGRVHALLGNHDVLVLTENTNYMLKNDLNKFKKFDLDPKRGMLKILTTEPYQSMMQEWKAMIQIGDNVFVHGGLDEWIFEMPPQILNETVKDFIVEQQSYLKYALTGSVSVPPEIPPMLNVRRSKNFLPDNPLMTRKMANRQMKEQMVDNILDNLSAKRIFIAHTPTKSGKIETSYTKKIIKTDTKMSSGMPGGNLSCVRITKKGKVQFHNKIKKGLGENALKRILKKSNYCKDILNWAIQEL